MSDSRIQSVFGSESAVYFKPMSDEVIRTFIAVDLPTNVLDALGQISSQLQEKLPGTAVRWVNFEKMHLTLKFLGDISRENIGMVEKILQTEASKRGVMEIGVGGIGAFPKARHPRVIWVGVEAPPDLFDRPSHPVSPSSWY